jgi:hypothetical protein
VSLLTAKGVILRQVRCRLLPFFVARFRAAFFPNDFVRGWCLSKNDFHDGLFQRRFMVGVNVGNCRRTWLRVLVGIVRGLPVVGAWLRMVGMDVSNNFATRLARHEAIRLATELAPDEAFRETSRET